MSESKSLLKWRRKQKRGKIMKPSTFKNIVKNEEKRGLSKDKAERAAGSAYWQAARAKHKKKEDGVEKEIKKIRTKRR